MITILPRNPIGDAAHAAACSIMPGPCAVNGAVHAGASAAGTAAQNAAGSAVLQPVVDAFNDSAGFALKWSVGLFTEISPSVSGSTSGIDSMRSALNYVACAIAVGCLIIAGAKMGISADARHGRAAAKGLGILVLVTGASIGAYSLLADFSASFGQWIVKGAGGNDAGVSKMTASMGTAGLGFALLFALIAMIVSLLLIAASIIRGAIAIVVLAFLPAISAGTIIDWGLPPFKKAAGWLGSAAIYPAVAGTVFAIGIDTFAKATDGKAVAESLALMLLAPAMLPALMRLVAPVTATGGGAALAVGGALAATGARLVASHHSSSNSGSNSSQSASGASTSPSGASQAPSGAAPVGGSPYAGPKTPSGAGAAGSAGAAGVAGGAIVQGAVNLAKKVKSHANSEATPKGAQ